MLFLCYNIKPTGDGMDLDTLERGRKRMTELEGKTKHMLGRLKEEKNDILNYFPHIVDDLEFYIIEYPKILSESDSFCLEDYIFDLQKTRIEYFTIVVAAYMKLMWKRDFKYEVDITPTSATASYNYITDKASFYMLAMLMNSNNSCDDFRTMFHEFRHSLQHHYLRETDMEKILDYPANFITIAKNDVPNTYNIFTKKDYEIFAYTQGRQYYDDNYKILYTELDANHFGIEEAKTFLYKLYELSPFKNKDLEEQVLRITKKLREEAVVVKEELMKENKIDPLRVEEITTTMPITSTISFNHKEEDGLLFTDKVFREHMDLIELNPVLKLLVDSDRIKSYEEILQDKERYSKKYDPSKVDKLYEQIIRTSPMLLISKYIVENDVDRVYKFLEAHPTFVDEYQDEIKELLNTLETPSSIRKLLLRNSYQKKKNYGIIM